MAQARAGGGQSGGASGRGGGSGPAGEWGSGPLGRAPRLGVRAPRLSAARGSGASRQPRATLAAPAVVRSPRSEPGRGAPARSRGSPCGRHWPPRGPLSPRRSRQRLDYLLSLFGLLLPQTELLTPKHGTGPEQPLQPPAAAAGFPALCSTGRASVRVPTGVRWGTLLGTQAPSLQDAHADVSAPCRSTSILLAPNTSPSLPRSPEPLF